MPAPEETKGETVRGLIQLVRAVQGPIEELAKEQNCSVETCVNNLVKDVVMTFLNGKSAAFRQIKNEAHR